MDSAKIREIVETELLGREIAKPARYVGGELNSVVKSDPDVRFALCFPELYEIGMSNTGFLILYHLINSTDWASCERCFAPWPDMEAALRARGVPLYSLETFTRLRDFDAIGFSLSYEMTYTNVLTMLDLAEMPLRAADRGEDCPIVIGGGVAAYNPEPVADFFDAFFVGEAEESVLQMLEIVSSFKRAGFGKKNLLKTLSQLPGFYVPSLYDISRNSDGMTFVTATAHAPRLPVRRSCPAELADTYYPASIVLPSIMAVHDRINVEVFRGCVRGCRYCQAGMIYRPMRERPVERIVSATRSLYKSMGCDEMTLLSLNATDYSDFATLLSEVCGYATPRKVSVSVPSTRVDSFTGEIGASLRAVRATGLTLAPEAGTQRLRDIINKRITDDDIETAVKNSFEAGWHKIKLYFMIGLPGETDEDVVAIAELVKKICFIAKGYRKGGKRGKMDFTLSISSFVPKSHTPFQWEAFEGREELLRKQILLRQLLSKYPIKIDCHDIRISILESVFARGDRRLGAVIESAWRAGARFDGWLETFKPELWDSALAENGLTAESYGAARASLDEPLPWSHIDTGISTAFFRRERERAFAATPTPDCLDGTCVACGIGCTSPESKA